MVSTELVEKCRLFREFSEEEKELLARHFREVRFKKGELLFDEFEPAKGFFLISKGKVALLRSDNFGRWTKVAAVYGGVPLGECAFFLGTPHSLRAVAEEEVEALYLSREDYEALKAENPKLAVKLLEVVLNFLADRLKSEDRKFAQVCGFFSVSGGNRWRR
ncbi:Crp/Fnr family transcriptional regulator [Thermovibrio ammonificans]|jgi:CRP-like cAMP-binding protein